MGNKRLSATAVQRLMRVNECLLSFKPDPTENIKRLTTLCGELMGALGAAYKYTENDTYVTAASWKHWDKLVGANACRGVSKAAKNKLNPYYEKIWSNSEVGDSPPGMLTCVCREVRNAGAAHGVICAIFDESYRLGSFDRETLGIIAGALQTEEARRRYQISLHERDRKLRELVNSVNSIILEVDSEGRITFINQYALNLFGFSEKEILACNIVGTVLQAGEAAECNFRDMIKNPEKYAVFESESACQDEKKLYVAWTSKVMLSNDGNFSGVLYTGNDITQFKESEQEKALLREQLRQSQKMDAIGCLAGGIAHDFNNLLTVINGHCELMADALDDKEQTRKDIEIIHKAGKRAASLTRKLLLLSRKQVINQQVLNLNDVIDETEKILKRVIGEHIVLATDLEPNLTAIEADPGQLEQIILNLVVNARDAMPDGGAMSITTRNIELDALEARRLTLNSAAYVLMSVSDTGVGMDEETIAHAFEPFFTTKEGDKGTGLGLSTVYGIVEQMDGRVAIKSEPGKGSLFRIFLPRSEKPLVCANSESLRQSDMSGTETILFVEDDAGVRDLSCKILRRFGYTVFEARHGADAMRFLETHKGKIHLVITDVVMPKMGGERLARALAKNYHQIKILFVSGYNNIMVAGVSGLPFEGDLLQKPFTPLDLVNKTRNILDRPAGKCCKAANTHQQKPIKKNKKTKSL